MTHYLKFESEEAMRTALSAYYFDDDEGNSVLSTGNHEYAIDNIGSIFEPTGETETDEEGNEVALMSAVEGYHVNFLGDLPEALVSYKIEEPSTPARVFAGHEPVVELVIED